MVNLRDACTRSIAYPGREERGGGGRRAGASAHTISRSIRDSAERLLQCPALSDIMWWDVADDLCCLRRPSVIQGFGSARRGEKERIVGSIDVQPRGRVLVDDDLVAGEVRACSQRKRGGGKGLRRRREGALREATGGRAPGALSAGTLPAHPPPRPAQDPFVLCLLLRTPTRFLACRARASWLARPRGERGRVGGLTLGDEPNNK